MPKCDKMDRSENAAHIYVTHIAYLIYLYIYFSRKKTTIEAFRPHTRIIVYLILPSYLSFIRLIFRWGFNGDVILLEAETMMRIIEPRVCLHANRKSHPEQENYNFLLCTIQVRRLSVSCDTLDSVYPNHRCNKKKTREFGSLFWSVWCGSNTTHPGGCGTDSTWLERLWKWGYKIYILWTSSDLDAECARVCA